MYRIVVLHKPSVAERIGAITEQLPQLLVDAINDASKCFGKPEIQSSENISLWVGFARPEDNTASISILAYFGADFEEKNYLEAIKDNLVELLHEHLGTIYKDRPLPRLSSEITSRTTSGSAPR